MTIDMTIDEAIEKYKEIANSDTPCPRYCMLPCDKCVDESKQLVEWLEELVMLRLDSCMIHMPERLHLVEIGYNKAIDDMYNELQDLLYHDLNITLDRLLEIKNQLKK